MQKECNRNYANCSKRTEKGMTWCGYSGKEGVEGFVTKGYLDWVSENE